MLVTSQAVAAVLLAVLVGCGSGGGTTPRRDGGDDQVTCVPGQPFDIGGSFAVLATLNEHVEVLGLTLEDPNPQAEVLMRTDLVPHDGMVDISSVVCALKLPDVQLQGLQKPLRFIAPAELLASEPAVTVGATVSGQTTCATYETQGSINVILGARLAQPATDFLPTNAATQGCGGDPLAPCIGGAGVGCVCDQEGDGKPGATLGIENAPVLPDLNQVYVTERLTISMRGVIFSSDLMHGTVDTSLELTILGCHRATGDCDPGAAAAIKNINPSITQDPSYTSPFISKRIDPSWDCLRVAAERQNLFPR
ncbi:MAG TPA: hypothetical protein VGQ83_06960 [Polyangia bacterium]